MTNAVPLSGTQYELALGDYRAVIASVGASLRVLTHAGRNLVVPFEADELRPGFRGATLAPWPNRIADGKYTFGGVEYQVPLTEPERGNALHGLAGWLDYQAVEHTATHVLLVGELVPQAGYPFRVLIQVRYELTDDGLLQRVTASNTGGDPAPWGTGPHPYLVAGEGRVDDWSLELPASEVLEVSPDRLLPVSVENVANHASGSFDFQVERPIGDVFIDHAFTSLLPGNEAGTVTVRLHAGNGSGVEMAWHESLPWVQIHTADQPDPARHRLGLAVEPMTCPPDAFNSEIDLIVLAPGESSSAEWTIRAVNRQH